MKRNYKLYDHASVADALVAEMKALDLESPTPSNAARYLLLEHTVMLLRDYRPYVQTLHDRIIELEKKVVSLGGGFDRRGLDGDPREPRTPPQVLKQGSWVDEGSHA